MQLGRTIAFHSYKGGTGKTSMALNVAYELSKKGKSGCLIELDFRSPSLSFVIDNIKKPNNWINDYLNNIRDTIRLIRIIFLWLLSVLLRLLLRWLFGGVILPVILVELLSCFCLIFLRHGFGLGRVVAPLYWCLLFLRRAAVVSDSKSEEQSQAAG